MILVPRPSEYPTPLAWWKELVAWFGAYWRVYLLGKEPSDG